MDRQVFNNVTGQYHFKVVCVQFIPWAMTVNTPNGPQVEGIFYEIIDSLAKTLHFTFEYISTPDLDFGIYLGNGLYDGVAGQIQRKEMDMITPWVIGPNRDASITPSEVTFFTVCKILGSVGKLEGSNFIGFVTTFDVENPPASFIHVDSKDPTVKRISGPTVHLFIAVMNSLNIKYNITHGTFTGYGNRKPNGQWTGLVGIVQRDETDVILTAMAANYARQEIITYSYPFYISGLTIMSGSPPPTSRDITGLVMVFDLQVWAGLLLSFSSLIFVSSFYVNWNESGVYLKAVTSKKLYNIICDYVGALFLEGTPRDPVTDRSRILFAVWWLVMLVMANAFCGHFRSSMMVELEGEKIRDLPHLANMTHRITPVIWKGTIFEESFRTGESHELQAIWKAVVKANSARTSRELYTMDNLKRMASGQEALINEIVSMKYLVGLKCSSIDMGNIYTTNDELFLFLSAYAFRKDIDPKMLAKINQRILWVLESQIFHRWLAMENRPLERCTSSGVVGPHERPLGLREMGGIFLILLYCLGFSCIGLVLELVIYYVPKILMPNLLKN